ncbi:hypothetical protein J2T22_001644 [Pseudarthrobacter defluvii]|uniref:Uncharacterized protein n=1 Tax=Pseudarthrobacter defluvii TaxID=410837 RepID=A0ABT9UHG7_9MICC|nr:hypothetical protein [Pseudarthrobacter defluvii]MDQ0118466.1 hypothetical protein [Pseudarthrobacter defluvii]
MAEDDQQLVIPDIDGTANFWTSQNAWGVAVQHDAQGEVELTIGPYPPEDRSLIRLHEGILHTSRRLIEIQTVYLDCIAKLRTKTQDAVIPIWSDDARQPEHVHIQCHDVEEIL